jgi:hypothetical protein
LMSAGYILWSYFSDWLKACILYRWGHAPKRVDIWTYNGSVFPVNLPPHSFRFVGGSAIVYLEISTRLKREVFANLVYPNLGRYNKYLVHLCSSNLQCH